MDREDKRRYLLVGFVIIEIVSPLLRKRLEEGYKRKGFGCLQNFIGSLPVKHILFHLRHKNSQCCVDEAHCFNLGPLPLYYSQWKRLYTEDHGRKGHHCHCKYTAKPISLNDLDITLTSLILLNCFSLTPNEYTLISDLREIKNNYFSHNIDCRISETEYNTLWKDLKTYVLQLDPSKEIDLVIIQNRPLDEDMCEKYATCLIDVHVILERIETKIDATAAERRTTMYTSTTETRTTIDKTNAEVRDLMDVNNVALVAKIEEMFQNNICLRCKRQINEQDKQEQQIQLYKLGQFVFSLHHQIDLISIVGDDWRGDVTDIVLMDDGKLVFCSPNQTRLLICNTDGTQVDSISMQDVPWNITAVNNSTVAVTLYKSECIEMFDINNKLKLKSISVPEMCWCSGITTLNNKIVAGGDYCLLVIDHQTGEKVQTIRTDHDPFKVHGSGDRIYYRGNYCNNKSKLYWYSYTDYKHHKLTLPSQPIRMTTLQDGSLYVVCDDGSVQHVSSDGKRYKLVTTKELTKLKYLAILYNPKQRKLVTRGDEWGKINVFYEK